MTIGQGIILYVFLIPLGLYLVGALISKLAEYDRKYRDDQWKLRKEFKEQNEKYEKNEFLIKLKLKLV